MNFFEAETRLREINQLIVKEKSPRFLLYQIIKYFNEVNESFNENLREPFVCDLKTILPSLLKRYSPFGIVPNYTQEIVLSIESMLQSNQFKNHSDEINSEIIRIKNELSDLKNLLKGVNRFSSKIDQIYFPTIEQNSASGVISVFIDSLQVTLTAKRGINENEFLLYPSAIDVEQRIKEQVKVSWNYAKEYVLTKFGRKIPFFQVVIKLEKHYAIYEGASLGIALVILFISKILRYLNLREEVSHINSVIYSGEVKMDGSIPSMTSNIIQHKLRGVFFSTFSTFVIPKSDEDSALKRLAELNKDYPERKLDIIGVKNVEDIFNRRNLVELKKTNLLKWGSKKVLNNKLSLSLLIVLITLITGYLFFTVDNNPVRIDFIGKYIHIKNKYDKLLWSKPSGHSEEYINNANDQDLLLTRIIDFNNDGINEVLLTELKFNNERDHNIYLFDSDGNEIWSYFHYDTITTVERQFRHTFSIKGIIDTIHNANRIELLLYFQHENYYPSGIVRLNLKTGKRIGDVLWHSGAITGAILLDWNRDGKKEIIAGGVSNGMERAFLFSIDEDKLKGTFPTKKKYQFIGMQLADFNEYILFPQTDYAQHFFPKYNTSHGMPHILGDLISTAIYEGRADMINADFRYSVRLDKNLKPIYSIIGDHYVVHRDNLVKQGILKPPFTDTEEFRKSIMENIEYWDGNMFKSFGEK